MPMRSVGGPTDVKEQMLRLRGAAPWLSDDFPSSFLHGTLFHVYLTPQIGWTL